MLAQIAAIVREPADEIQGRVREAREQFLWKAREKTRGGGKVAVARGRSLSGTQVADPFGLVDPDWSGRAGSGAISWLDLARLGSARVRRNPGVVGLGAIGLGESARFVCRVGSGGLGSGAISWRGWLRRNLGLGE